MSLISAINKSVSGINVAQMGLQVVSNNIANANTPGYIRQELVQSAGDAVRIGGLIHGTGVRPIGIVQQIDHALADRLRTAASDLAANDGLESAHQQLEDLVNELGEFDLSSQLSSFNASLHDLANQPGDRALKQLVVLQGQTLADHVNRLSDRANVLVNQANGVLIAATTEINSLTRKISDLNKRIVDIEGGRTLGSDATGLRDDRETALNELAEFLDINTIEQSTGAVSVFVGGDFLVADNISRDVYSAGVDDDPLGPVEIRVSDTEAPLVIRSGRLAGATAARDEVYAGFINDLDDVAAGVAESINRVHSVGKGTVGFTEVRTIIGIDPTVGLQDAGLDFPPENGAFQIELYGNENKKLSSHQIDIDLFSSGSGTTLEDVATQIDAIDGLSASIASDGQLTIATSSPGLQFGFGSDSSGFLAAAGINTFFSGTDAATLSVQSRLLDDPELLAVSSSGIGTDVDNLTNLVDQIDRPLEQLGGISARDRYEQMVTTITQDATVQKSVTQGLETYHATLAADHLAFSSVNIDEEAIKMVYLQRAFQASSRVIAVASEMLEVLVTI